jgi:hypothetical protein
LKWTTAMRIANNTASKFNDIHSPSSRMPNRPTLKLHDISMASRSNSPVFVSSRGVSVVFPWNLMRQCNTQGWQHSHGVRIFTLGWSRVELCWLKKKKKKKKHEWTKWHFWPFQVWYLRDYN